MNDIYCYCRRVGDWKHVDPPDIVKLKRKVDKKAHISRPFFTPAFFTAYDKFINECFATFQGHGVDAKLKANLPIHRDVHSHWRDDWNKLFADKSTTEKALESSYQNLLQELSKELIDASGG